MTRYIEPPSNLNEIIDLYSKHGQTLLSLEKTTGYARNSLRQWFKKEGVKLKSHRQASTEANKRDAAVLPEKDSFIKDFGIMNLKELQEKYSIGQETLYKWMKIYDLKKSFSESVSIGKSKSFIAALPEIDNIKEEYTRLGNNKNALMMKHDLTRHQIDALFEINNIETSIPWRSRAEIELLEFVRNIDPSGEWTSSDKKIIAPFELDLYSEKRKMAIEYCGLYWHSQIAGKKESMYHVNKLKRCAEKGVRLVTVFESDPVEKIKSLIEMLLGKSKKIYGRDTTVEASDREVVNKHESDYHISGSGYGKVYYTLKHKKTGEILSTMSFGIPRFSKGYQWEIIRYTVKSGHTVLGGAEKLFLSFVKDHHPDTVMTYADLRFGQGLIYERLGFDYSHASGPNYWYFKKGSTKLMHRAGFQKYKLQSRLEKFDLSLTEFENMIVNGYDRIWDCGNAVYTWNKKSTFFILE